MTAPARQPQKEYIITSKEVDILQRNLSIPTTRILDDIRSRPHTSPSAPETEEQWRVEKYEYSMDLYLNGVFISKCKDMVSIQCVQGAVKRAQNSAAKAEREKVLALLEEWDYHNNRNFGKPHPMFADMIRLVREKPDEVTEHLKSLRAQQGGVSR